MNGFISSFNSALAEIVEMKRTGHMVHKTMVNLAGQEKHGKKFEDLLYGNKIVLLTGTYPAMFMIS